MDWLQHEPIIIDTAEGRSGEEQDGSAGKLRPTRHPFWGGVPQVGALLDLCLEHGVIERAGDWSTYEGRKIAASRDRGNCYQLPLIGDKKLFASLP